MVNTIINGLKVAGKVAITVVAGAVGLELGVMGAEGLVNDAVTISKKAPKPVVVKTSGFGPFKKAVVKTENIFTGEKYYTTVKVAKVKPVKAPKIKAAKKA